MDAHLKEEIIDDYTVPIAIQEKLNERACAFSENLQNSCRYCANAGGKFKGKFCERLGRLTYEGDTENMQFVIFNRSSGKYDTKRQKFPGSPVLGWND
jgi:hypothetical protein